MKNIRKKRGFTLIELIVSISIIGLVTTLSVANYRRGSNSGELTMAIQDVVSEVRKVQGYTMALKEHNDTFPDGWGIVFQKDSSEIVVFADLNTNNKFDGGNELFLRRPIALSENVVVTNINVGGTNYNYLYLVYSPPDPSVQIGGLNDPAGTFSGVPIEAKVTLTGRSGDTKIIEFNKFGLVDVQ